MLKKNQCLKTLDLSDESVGVEGALELIESLKHNTTLEKLMLSKKCEPPLFPSLVPRPRPAFRRFQYGKAGEGLE